MTLDELQEIAVSLENTPLAVRRLAEGLNEEQLRRKPPGGEFSVLENICHLRDIEEEGYAVRIQKILVEDRPLLVDLDGAQMAAERDYNSEELKAALDAFASAREANVRTIQGLVPEQLTRTGSFENTGKITLGRLLEMMREHDDIHIDELNKMRA